MIYNMCKLSEEDFSNFTSGEAYKSDKFLINGQKTFGNNVSYQNTVLNKVKSRH